MADGRTKININPDSFPIGTGAVYAEQVRNRVNRKIGGVYEIGTEYRNASLMNNPMTLRYKGHENAESSVGGEDIGQIYRLSEKTNNIKFLDEVNGLVGFTFGDESTSPGYEKNINSAVKGNFEQVKHNQGELFTDNYNFLYSFGDKSSVENPMPYEMSLNRLDKVYGLRDYGLFNNLTDEEGVIDRVENAMFMARQTDFERNSRVVAQRYFINGGGVKFADRYVNEPDNNHSYGGVDTRGLANRVSQLYADVFGITDFRANVENRFYTKMLYNPALPLNPVNMKSEEFRRYNPINILGYRPVFIGYDDDTYRENQIFYDGEINQEGGVTNILFDTLDRIFEYYKEDRLIALTNQGNRYNYIEEDSQYIQSRRGNSNPQEYSTNYPTDYIDGDSVDIPQYRLETDVETAGGTDYRIEGDNRVYGLYDERTRDGNKDHLDINNKVNVDRSTSVTELYTEGEYDSAKNKGLLYKTNELFKQGKINSLINRFYQSRDKEHGVAQSSVDDDYGLSRGRNLRKWNDAVDRDVNGYDNPWCRVWTSHYQYSKMKDLIRHEGYGIQETMFPHDLLRPNNGHTRIGAFSTLQDNGLPLIAPYNSKTEKPKDLIKRCMFSIENLAWKDVNKNALVDGKGTVLSQEQQGPNGGRIMWFPPYNLNFQENVGVNWNQNNFIGRGEPIFTYTNTERTGTLNFTILVDHPSIVDSWSLGKEINGENEQKLLKFFAGCYDPNEFVEGATTKEVEKKKEVEKEIIVEGEPTLVPKPNPDVQDIIIRYFVFFPNNFSGIDYVKNGDSQTPAMYLLKGQYSGGTDGYELYGNGVTGCIKTDVIKGGQMKGGGNAYWHYEVDNDKKTEALAPKNYSDTKSFGLNSHKFTQISGYSGDERNTIISMLRLTDDDLKYIYSYEDLTKMTAEEFSKFFTDIPTGITLQDSDIEITAEVKGYASSHGYVYKNAGEDGLAKRRAKFIRQYVINKGLIDAEKVKIVDDGVIDVPKGNLDVNSIEAKLGRCAEIMFKLHVKRQVPNVDALMENGQLSEADIDQYFDKVFPEITTKKVTNIESYTETITDGARYDDEYEYFKKINQTDDLVRKNLIKKVQYFDPAFHSITPEGFNARLTFLHQCTRQGPTTSVSDASSRTPMAAGNLAFGRPPVCVLKIGDFYNTKIIIDSLSIDYDNSGGVQWDLNPEGVGVQPMLANVTIGFKFLGGSDLSGPIARLQNAVSYNFFANASVYDRHADYREGYITPENDTSQAWDAMRVERLNNTTKHREFTTNVTPKTTDNNVENN